MTGDRGRLRILFLMVGAGLMAAVLVSRLAYWQVLQHDRIQLLANEQHQVTFKLPAQRGKIFDRNAQLLATNTRVYNVVAAPDLIPPEQKTTIASAIAPLLQIDQAEVSRRLQMPLKFEYLKRKVPQEAADQIAAKHLTGIALEADQRRAYLTSADPAPGLDGRSLAANLIGFVNDDGAGQYGLEQFYDKALRGTDGFESTLKTGANQTIQLSDREKVAPRNGADLLLGLDSQVQFFAEKALADGVKKSGAESGSVIVLEPTTGNIIAWADYPTFDANHFAAADAKWFSDPVVAGVYEPGSVMKVVTLSGGIDDGAIAPDYTFNETGSVSVGGYTIRNWDFKAHGNVDMTYVLGHSLNVGAVKVEQLEGPDHFYHYLQAFGIGRATGVDLAGEVSQPLRPLRNMHASELATTSFGQGVAVTPAEMISAVNVVASGGHLVHPRAAVGTITDGRRTDLLADPGPQAIKPETAAMMRDMMVQVVEKGSGWTARMDGWKGRIAGKTGTANIPEGGRYSDKVVASFVGFMPADNPRFTMLVVMRKPQGDALHQEGTFAAAPVWKQIAQQILVQWQITP